MEVTLVLAKGEPKGKQVVLSRFPAAIGRDPGCSIVIASPKVSRKHCRLDDQGGALVVTDEGSGNGTYVNGQRIVQPTTLSAGDNLTVGPLGFKVQLGADIPAITELVGEEPPLVKNDLNDFLASLEAGGPAKTDSEAKS
jgi:pSer/pThr/pTyr-binding forkhead associated (FHA) protein